MSNDFSNNEILLMFKEIKDTLARIEKDSLDHAKRLTILELWKEGFMAKITGIVATISILWVVIKEVILKK